MVFDPILLGGSVLGLLTAFVVHEYAHARAAYSLGDPTSKYAGRLTLDPRVHLDPVGSLCLLVSMLTSQGRLALGWAKPVMFDRDNFKSPYLDGALVALAGPISNLVLAFGLALLMRLALPGNLLIDLTIRANLGFVLFNLFPLPPLDGWKVLQAFVPSVWARSMQRGEERLGIYAPVLLLCSSPLLIRPIFSPLYSNLALLLTGH